MAEPGAAVPSLLDAAAAPNRSRPLCAAGFRDLLHQQQVGRPGEQESAGLAVAVDGDLHGAQQVGRVLHFVQSHRLRAAKQRLRLFPSRVQNVEVVQRGIATRWHRRLRQR